MTGERTPDSSPANRSGSSDDEISLREHVQRQLDVAREFTDRIIAEQREYFLALLAERKERFETLNDGLSRLLDERSVASDKAVHAALSSAEEAISKVEKTLEERFIAQARALDKAEAATDKRFDSVNEFRAQLADLIRGFMPRGESEVRMQGMADRVELNANAMNTGFTIQSERINKMELATAKRLDVNEGKSTGRGEIVAWIFAGAGFLATLGALIAYAGK